MTLRAPGSHRPSTRHARRNRDFPASLGPVIIWINGAFGAGKTALAEELRRRLPDAVLYNPEDVGLPMSLIRDGYRAEILGGLADAGEEVLHVFLGADACVLRERLNARVTHPGREWDQAASEFGMTGMDEMAAAAARQPAGTLMLRSDKLTPAELADEVLARSQG
jgi:hypothetical protein